MSALIVICKTLEKTETVRFAFEDGQMNPAIELLATYLMELGAPESVHEAVSCDRLGVILRQNMTIKNQAREIAELKEWAAFVSPPVKEMVR